MIGMKNMVNSGKAVYISPSSLPGIGHGDAIFLGLSEDKLPIFVVNVEDLSRYVLGRTYGRVRSLELSFLYRRNPVE